MAEIKKTGKYAGKSNVFGHGGRAAQMKAQGIPGGVIGNIARAEGAAPGGPNYHGRRSRKSRSAKKRMSVAEDKALDKKKGIKEGSKEDEAIDSKLKKRATKKKSSSPAGYPDQTTTPDIESGNALRSKKRGGTKKRSTGFGPGIKLGLSDINPGKVTMANSTPRFAPGKGTAPTAQLDAGGVPMAKRKRAPVPQRRSHRSMSGMQLLNKATKGKC